MSGEPVGNPTTTAKIIPSRSKGAPGGASSPPLEASHGVSLPPLRHASSHSPHTLPPIPLPTSSHHRRPSSPSVHLSPATAHASPSTAHASPLTTPRLPIAAADGVRHPRKINGGVPRSSVACTNCRKSKVKCTNEGPGSTCDTCKKGKKECEYTHGTAAAESATPRREAVPKNTHDASVERTGETSRKRRKIAPTATIINDGSPTDADLLELKPETCLELFDIFEQHYATDLPFLHAPTFKEMLAKGNFAETSSEAQLSRIYAFVALTAPFHPSFATAPLSKEKERHIEAVELAKRYAKAAHAKVSDAGFPTLETIEALLMLAIHEWTIKRGATSFRTLSCAITDAQQLNCHQQEDLMDERQPVCEPLSVQSNRSQGKERWIEEETKRRIYWSCYILESFFCSTNRRLRRIHEEDLLVQLPCSERAFKHGKKVRTRVLHETDDAFEERRRTSTSTSDVKWEDEDQQETLCWYIRALVHWRKIIHWSCVVSRRNEEYPPWDSKSVFYQLRVGFELFIEKLPEEIRLGFSQTRTHIEDKTSRSYTVLHAVLNICDIALHREWLPWAPFGLTKPSGPIDAPLVEGSPPDDDADYWDKSAQRCFQGAKNIIELMWSCHENKVLVHTPLIGFAIYSSCFTVVWCKFFPQFDTKNLLCKDGSTRDVLLIQNADRLSDLLWSVKSNVDMVSPWIHTLHKFHDFFIDAKKSYKEQSNSPASNGSSPAAQIRLPGMDVQGYLMFEKDQKHITEHESSYRGDVDNKHEKLNIHEGLDEHDEAYSPAPPKREDDDERTDVGSPDRAVHQHNNWTAVNNENNHQNHEARHVPGPEPQKVAVNGNASSYVETYFGSYPQPTQNAPTHYMTPIANAGYAPDMSGHPHVYHGTIGMPQDQQLQQLMQYWSQYGHSEGVQVNNFSNGNEWNDGNVPVHYNNQPFSLDPGAWRVGPSFSPQPPQQ